MRDSCWYQSRLHSCIASLAGHARRGAEELGAYRTRIEALGVPEAASPRGPPSEAGMASWPCTPSKADRRASPTPGLFRWGFCAVPLKAAVSIEVFLAGVSNQHRSLGNHQAHSERIKMRLPKDMHKQADSRCYLATAGHSRLS